MPEVFIDKEGNPLERGVLYNLPPLSWPLSFQFYEFRWEGDFKILKAVFLDFNGHPNYFNKKKVISIATKPTSEKMREYISSAKTLVEWLSNEEPKITQRQAKCTDTDRLPPERD